MITARARPSTGKAHEHLDQAGSLRRHRIRSDTARRRDPSSSGTENLGKPKPTQRETHVGVVSVHRSNPTGIAGLKSASNRRHKDAREVQPENRCFPMGGSLTKMRSVYANGERNGNSGR